MIQATEFLLQSQNTDGGWGYRAGGMSYVEPTSAVLLALKNQPTAEANRDTAIRKARDFLISLEHPDGGWGIGAIDSESGWMTAWAVLALANLGEEQSILRGVDWLLKTEGLRIVDANDRAAINAIHQIDSALRGWPWQPGDASWVHPTALSVLALAAARRLDHVRVKDGIDFLLDRAVASGGWNIGDREMFGKPVPPTVQDTAVALLALQAGNKSREDAKIGKAVDYLGNAMGQARTPAELAWGIFALGAWKADTGNLAARLNAMQSPDGSWRANPFITAVATLANTR
jgi:hypothetical protein